MSNSNHLSISHRLGDICTSKCSAYLLSLGQIVAPPPAPTPLTLGAIFLKIELLHFWVQGKPYMGNEIDWLNTFRAVLLTDTRTDTQSDCLMWYVLARTK